jgi:predicted Zn-ribbon and HTH transcriptional regulator
MKASKQCPKCRSTRVGALAEALYDDDYQVGVHYKPLPVGVTAKGVVGRLEAYLCADCGYYETYVKDPASIPFEAIQGFRWVNEATGA